MLLSVDDYHYLTLASMPTGCVSDAFFLTVCISDTAVWVGDAAVWVGDAAVFTVWVSDTAVFTACISDTAVCVGKTAVFTAYVYFHGVRKPDTLAWQSC